MGTEHSCTLRLTFRAEADMEDIWLHGAAEWSPEQADRYVDGITAVLDLLCAMPGIARKRLEFTPPVRIHPSGIHLIIYRTVGDHLDVLRILGGRQDWQRLLEMLE
ncbi:type II toxin-antitoxin system RelE/ParE family toxin (plasmid) [Paracoccus liaowanqingii]|uniref:Type II toxin-antitoxin system RelE/ParE family toxin n=1 Tax=Paracoccus liaowanqingii TaxID=2560053 RepID=A0A4Y5SQK7_9RHOB|nr:type II toxin-antitoxin system RelE/ParE family toxin [Paracoccus liaowanqingii]QDA35777.1 type II toxin-antitoxin system RelE/ParE family toxin [Paracoccus liaowanqingii]